MKKSQFVLLTGLCLWLFVSLASAETWIKNLSIEKQGEFVAVKIFGSQPFQFSHATEVAKNGKPFRVFVDCQEAKLGLPQNNYFDLPGQTVVGLRTSQYKENPSVVRIVMDCVRPVTYKVNSQDNWIEINIASPNEPAFTRWEASQGSQPQIAAATPPTKTQPATATPQPSAKTATKAPMTLPEVTVQAQAPKTDATNKQSQPTASKSAEPTKPAPTVAKAQEQPKPALAKPSVPQIAKTDNQAKASQSQTAQATAPSSLKKVDSQSSPSTPPVLTQKPSTSGGEQKPLVLAQKPEAEQWVGYPKREKVVYSTKGKRDPFSPLFDRIEDYEFGVAPLASIENLTLVGVLQSFNQNLALLEDSRGFGYILQAGDRVKDGRVLRVDQDQVVFQMTEYGWTRNVTLELYNQTK